MHCPIPKRLFRIIPMLLCSLLVLSEARSVHAQEGRSKRDNPERAPAPAPVEPWNKGVSEEQREKAFELFQEGIALNKQFLLDEARGKYEEALLSWEHPRIRFYLARLYKRTGLPLLAYENLKKAIAWGPGALDREEKDEADTMLHDLEGKELGAISMRCDEKDAEVLLDGKAWGSDVKRLVLPGEHVVTAKKAGYYTTVKSIAVSPGKEVSGVIHLSVDGTYAKRRWAAWKPWVMLGAGAGLAGMGGGFLALARKNANETTQLLIANCSSGSCDPDTTGPYNGAQIENAFGIGALVVGGAGLLGGAGMLLLNLPQSVRTQDESDVKVEVAPLVSSTIAGISMRVVF
jgi:hypothetical protein